MNRPAFIPALLALVCTPFTAHATTHPPTDELVHMTALPDVWPTGLHEEHVFHVEATPREAERLAANYFAAMTAMRDREARITRMRIAPVPLVVKVRAWDPTTRTSCCAIADRDHPRGRMHARSIPILAV